MIELTGRKVSSGIAIGKIKFLKKDKADIPHRSVKNIEAEISRYESAKKLAVEQLNTLYEKTRAEVGEAEAELFSAHIMMLDDGDYNESVVDIIRLQKCNAEYAVHITGSNFAAIFANMEDEYFSARAADILDVTNRVVAILSGRSDDKEMCDEPTIILADDLAPSETVQLDRSNLLAFVTRFGSANSHTAILARTMGIPALVDTEIHESWNEKIAIVDGYEGKLYVDPDAELLEQYREKKEFDQEQRNILEKLKGKENITKSGKSIEIHANIGSPEDLAAVIDNDAGGIGLFRSEFLYLDSDTLPTEEEQLEAYKKVLETMGDKRVVIRTMDIGADKQVDYLELGREDNPALGCRAIRICLTRPEIFRTQLRALFRASSYGNLAIMYPMIIDVSEVKKIKKITKQVRDELLAEGIEIGDVEEGIMIETPAAAIMSEELAEEVDFFSIGTNDLTQYTLAVDRQNAKLDEFVNPHHPAVLRLIEMVVKNAHKSGIWVGICGELAADQKLTEKFLNMGVDELSVSPGIILPLRSKIRQME